MTSASTDVPFGITSGEGDVWSTRRTLRVALFGQDGQSNLPPRTPTTPCFAGG